MNRFYGSVLICLSWLVSSAAWADMKPTDSNAPVFEIYSSSGSGKTITAKQPLLVISSVANVQLSTDRKAVRVVLTPSDARKFADVTRKHVNDLLILQANGRVLEAMQVASPVTNGILEFAYPDDAAVADYLRKRFRLR